MVWVWKWAQDDWGAEFDGEHALGQEVWSSQPLPAHSFAPVFLSRNSILKFQSRHCPDMGGFPCVDQAWQKIILTHVPADRVQFYPVTLKAKGGESKDFSMMIVFDRVDCIDEKRSKFTSVVHNPDETLYFGLDKVVHKRDCLGSLHLARDTKIVSHLLVSDLLRNALAETGECSMFFRPESLPLV
jgi:hypothetical protein